MYALLSSQPAILIEFHLYQRMVALNGRLPDLQDWTIVIKNEVKPFIFVFGINDFRSLAIIGGKRLQFGIG